MRTTKMLPKAKPWTGRWDDDPASRESRADQFVWRLGSGSSDLEWEVSSSCSAAAQLLSIA